MYNKEFNEKVFNYFLTKYSKNYNFISYIKNITELINSFRADEITLCDFSSEIKKRFYQYKIDVDYLFYYFSRVLQTIVNEENIKEETKEKYNEIIDILLSFINVEYYDNLIKNA